MSRFGKLRDCAPPTPPRRSGDDVSCDKLQDEFEDESDEDMYEVPPCERPINVPQIPKEDSVYLERPNHSVPRRQAPPPRPKFPMPTPGDFFFETQNVKPPEVNRTEKPGRKMTRAPVAAPPESEEDVYLDPCEEQDSSEELYLEPAEACSLPPRETKMMSPSPSFKPALPLPGQLLKPPDRLSSLTTHDFKTDPGVESRLFSLSMSPPVAKPWMPTYLKDRPGSQDSSMLQSKLAGVETKSSVIKDKEWFAGNCSRKMAEDLLLSIKKDGAFLIRNSSTQNWRQPYTLAVLYQLKVYNIPVRFLDNAQGYALGKEGKKNEEVFSSIDDMVSYHKNNKLLLIDSKSQAKHTTCLTNAAHL